MTEGTALQIEEFVAEYIAQNKSVSPRVAIAEATKRFPDCPALDAAFAFISVASALEQPIIAFSDEPSAFIEEMYRSIAAFVADIYAVEKLVSHPATCSQVCEFWFHSKDTYF